MRIIIRVKPNSRQESLEKVSDGEFIVRVKAPPQEGRANDAVIKALAEYFGVPKSRISIARGKTGKVKVIEIL